jgi:hypothetical protein
MENPEPDNGEEAIDEQGRNPTQQRIDRESQQRPDEVQDGADDALAERV